MRLLNEGPILVIAIILMSSPLPLRTAYAQEALGWEILSLLNSARVANGIPPLAMNSRLVAAAQRQSDDMAESDYLSHTGSDGSEFWSRMTAAGYNLSAGAENVLYRWDANALGVYQQWRDSPPHYTNMTNPAYQEVGIAHAVAVSGKHYFTMVLGARPDFEPPTAAAPTDILASETGPPVLPPNSPITPTEAVFPATSTSAPPATIGVPAQLSVQPVGTPMPLPASPIPTTRSPEPLTDALTSTSSMPPAIPTARAIFATAAQSSDLAPENPPNYGDEPPADLPLSASGDHTAPVYATLDTSRDPIQPRSSLREFIRRYLAPSVLEIASLTPSVPTVSAIIPTLIPVIPAEPVIADLRLEFTDESFTIINVAGSPVYIEGLRFESQTGVLEIDHWDTAYLSAPLDNFPDKGCLQVWGFEVDVVLSPPASCQIRHGWVVVGEDQQFWRNTEIFTVHRFDEAVTVCIVGLGSCDVNLSDRLTVYPTLNPPSIAAVDGVSPPQSAPEAEPADVQLLYSPESFTILNASGTILDLTGLGFSSSRGILNISQWDTEFLSRPLYAFPSGDCLQAWPLTASEWPEKPNQCNLRHSWIAVNDTHIFWADTDYFTVSRNGVVLGTCSVNVGQCEISFR